MNLPPYRKPASPKESDSALEERRTATREHARNAEASPPAPSFGPVLAALTVAELQAELDVLSDAIARYVASTEAGNVEMREVQKQIAAAATVTAAATDRAALATERAALAQERAANAGERAATATEHYARWTLILVIVTGCAATAAFLALRQPPPVVYNNVPSAPPAPVQILPAPVTVLPAPASPAPTVKR